MAARLTDVERAERKVSGGALQAQITDVAELLGWEWVHWRPLMTKRGFYQVPVEGPLGKGWPDLTLVRARDRRLVFAELKRQVDDQLSLEQEHVLEALRSIEMVDWHCGEVPLAHRDDQRAACCPPSIGVHVWRPSDLRDPIEESVIYQVLR